MTFKRYPIRAFKSIIMCLCLALIIFGLSYYLSPERHTMSFMELIERSNPTKIIIFLAAFGLIYPFIGYIRHNVALSHPFTAMEKEAIIKLFTDMRFKFVADTDGKLYFRSVNPAARITRMFEDTIEVDYTGNPLVVEGLRRDTYRIGKAIEWMFRKMEQEEE